MLGKRNRPKSSQEELLDLRRAEVQSLLSMNSHPKPSPQTSEKCNNRPVSGPVVVKHTVIHNFTKEIKICQEMKVISQPAATTRRIQAPQMPPKSKPEIPKPQIEQVQIADLIVTKADDHHAIKVSQLEVQSEFVLENRPIQTKLDELVKQIKVYRLGDIYNGRRILMNHLGIDIGTKTIVISYKNGDETQYISEINGYYPFERCTPFIKNMLNDPNKVRSDGTKRSARWLELDGKAIVLGKDAEEFAYAKNDTMLRPMAEGGISADEEAMTVLGAIVQGLMKMAEEEIGEFSEEVKICYCTTALAINKDSNVEYHERVINIIIEGYETKSKLLYDKIKESHAIVINMSEDGTGIGISWGAGTVTVSYVKYGLEIYSFCWVGAGDWIDIQVAMRHGYDPDQLSTRKKKAKETPTTVAKKKQSVDLTPGVDYSGDRLAMDIVLHYDVLISNVIDGIISGFEQNESEARIEDAIPIFMAGGTSSPDGFVERCVTKLETANPAFEIGEVLRSDNPLFTVASGCLKAAEMF